MKKVMVVVGTRPEVIKQAPIVWALRKLPDCKPILVSTGQHVEMLEMMLPLLDLELDISMGLMRPGQTLASFTGRCLEVFGDVLTRTQPDAVLVQGDTATTLACALAAFYQRIPVGHVEAGLRSGDRSEPFPEEMSRRLVDGLSDWLFAPTKTAASHLQAEALGGEIHVTGNTIVDALHFMVARQPVEERPAAAGTRPRTVLVTCHRRESFGTGLDQICQAIARLASMHHGVQFIFPVHRNPQVDAPVRRALGECRNVQLIEPMPYDGFLRLLAAAELVLTDSGGVQEEAPSLGVPVLVMRNLTERPEGLAAGCGVLVGTDPEVIIEHADRILRSGNPKRRNAENPYGDGHSGERIASLVRDRLS